MKGFNYIRLRAAAGRTGGDHATFDADTSRTEAHYDPDRAEAMFSALSTMIRLAGPQYSGSC